MHRGRKRVARRRVLEVVVQTNAGFERLRRIQGLHIRDDALASRSDKTFEAFDQRRLPRRQMLVDGRRHRDRQTMRGVVAQRGGERRRVVPPQTRCGLRVSQLDAPSPLTALAEQRWHDDEGHADVGGERGDHVATRHVRAVANEPVQDLKHAPIGSNGQTTRIPECESQRLGQTQPIVFESRITGLIAKRRDDNS